MTDVPDEVRALAAEREERRKARDFGAADTLRDRIRELGFTVVDGPQGPSLETVEVAPEPRVRPHDVESLLDQPTTADASVHWVVEGWPEDVTRALDGFRANEGGRDVQYVVPFLIQLLLYASPVAYGVSAVPASVRRLYLLNPIAPLLDGLRTALLGRGEVHWMAIGGSALAGVALFAAGTLFFLYQDRQYADVI